MATRKALLSKPCRPVRITHQVIIFVHFLAKNVPHCRIYSVDYLKSFDQLHFPIQVHLNFCLFSGRTITPFDPHGQALP